MPSKNEEYYLEDTVFQVEDQLFKVHRHLFVRLSQVFRDMYAIPVGEGAESDGPSDKQPLVLEGIKKKDFIQLLRCLYPLQYGDHNLEFSLEEWQSVLKLAARYEMAEIRIFVIKKMTPLLADFPSLQIHLSRTYNIQSWLGLGLSRLARRAEPLNEEDVRLVGLSDSLKICALRERKRRCDKCDSCRANTHSGGFTKDELGQEFGIRESDLPPFNKLCACSKRAVSDSESEGRSTWSLVLLSTERLSFITSYAESFKNENPTGPERGKKYYTALMLWMLDGHESEITIDISPCCCNLPSFPRTLSPLPKPRMRLSPNSNLTH